jgi:hypothetical protein
MLLTPRCTLDSGINDTTVTYIAAVALTELTKYDIAEFKHLFNIGIV